MPKKPKPKKRGPKPSLLKVKGPLDSALTTFLNKKKPAGGWPKYERPKAGTPDLAEEE